MNTMNSAIRYMLTSFLTMATLAVFAYWILSPPELRTPLHHLLSRSWRTFTGGNQSAWMVSHVYQSVFGMVTTLILVRVLLGAEAMKKHWGQTTVIALLALVTQIVFFHGPGFLRRVTQTVYEDRRLSNSTNLTLIEENNRVTEELKRWKTQSLTAQNPAKSAPGLSRESKQSMREDARRRASEVLESRERQECHLKSRDLL